MQEHNEVPQEELEQTIIAESSKKAEELHRMEQEKAGLDITDSAVFSSDKKLTRRRDPHTHEKTHKHSHLTKGDKDHKYKLSISPQERKGLTEIQEGISDYLGFPDIEEDLSEKTTNKSDHEKIDVSAWQNIVNEASKRAPHQLWFYQEIRPDIAPTVQSVEEKTAETTSDKETITPKITVEERFQRIFDREPNFDDSQDRFLLLLLGDNVYGKEKELLGLRKRINIDNTAIAQCVQDQIDRVFESKFAEAYNPISNVSIIAEVTGQKIQELPLDIDSLNKKINDGLRAYAETEPRMVNNRSHTDKIADTDLYYVEMLLADIDKWTNQSINIDKSVIDAVLAKELTVRARNCKRIWEYDDFNERRDKEYFVKTWDNFANRYGLPSRKVINDAYINILTDKDLWNRPVNTRDDEVKERLDYLQKFSRLMPSITELTQLARKEGKMGENESIEDALQHITKDQFLFGNPNCVSYLKQKFGIEFKPLPEDVQAMYARIFFDWKLYGPDNNENDPKSMKDLHDKLLSRTGIQPALEIIDAKYINLLQYPFIDESISEAIKEFYDIVKTPPLEEALQKKYEDLFKRYVETEKLYVIGNGEDDEYVDIGCEQYLIELAELSKMFDVSPHFNKDYVMQLYEFCLEKGEPYHHKLAIIAKETGIKVDSEFLQKHILDNKDFKSAIPFSVSSEMIDMHFNKEGNSTLEEYERIYSVFGCYDYYQEVLAKLEKDPSIESKKRRIQILTAMAVKDINKSDQYTAIKDKILAFRKNENKQVKKQLAQALSALASNGDMQIISQFVDTIKKRTNIKEAGEYLELTEDESLALRTLMNLDNPTANDVLFSLIFDVNLDPKLKKVILSNLTNNKAQFFPEKVKEGIRTMLKQDSSDIEWEDLSFYQAILKIPNADLRRKSINHTASMLGQFLANEGISLTDIHNNASYIPKNALIQVIKFTGFNPDLLEKFSKMYQNVKGTAERDNLLMGIVNALNVNEKVRIKITSHLTNLDFTAPDEARKMAAMLKTVAFLDTIERQLGQQEGSGLYDLLDTSVSSLEELNISLREIVTQRIKEALPNDSIDADKIQSLWEEWGTLEPIFVYAGKMTSSGNRGTLKLVAEVVNSMDPPNYDNWKRWRYNLIDSRVQKQLGNLTVEQRDTWMSDHIAELGDIMIAVSPTDRPKQVVSHLKSALREGHIYNPDIDKSTEYKFLQDKFQETFSLVVSQPERRAEIITKALTSIRDDMGKIDTITRYGSASRIQQAVNLFTEGQNVAVNKRTIDTINFISQFLLKEQSQQMQTIFGDAEEAGTSTLETNALCSPEIRQSLAETIANLESGYQQTLNSDIFEKYGLDKEQVRNMGQFYQKRQELKALYDLYRLTLLTPKLIATNRISEREDKGGETISQVIEGLRKYFKDNQTFLQDIENIQATVTQREELTANRRLAMIVTDNPQMLFQVGKYPIGCGSCQNYEGDPNWNKSLAAYVADAHIKAMFLIDLNKLPSSVQQEIEEKGFEEVKHFLMPQDMLEASIARAISKIVVTAQGKPVLFLEPTYTQINKGDLSMNKYFDVFAELAVAEPMKIKLARGVGKETIYVPDSRNPSGQYEDAAAGDADNAGMGIQTGDYSMSARFINKFSPVTEEDIKLAERISSGSSYTPYLEQYDKAA